MDPSLCMSSYGDACTAPLKGHLLGYFDRQRPEQYLNLVYNMPWESKMHITCVRVHVCMYVCM